MAGYGPDPTLEASGIRLIAHDDVADAVTAVLSGRSGFHDSATYTLTGYSLAAGVDEPSLAVGREIRHHEETGTEGNKSRERSDRPSRPGPNRVSGEKLE